MTAGCCCCCSIQAAPHPVAQQAAGYRWPAHQQKGRQGRGTHLALVRCCLGCRHLLLRLLQRKLQLALLGKQCLGILQAGGRAARLVKGNLAKTKQMGQRGQQGWHQAGSAPGLAEGAPGATPLIAPPRPQPAPSPAGRSAPSPQSPAPWQRQRPPAPQPAAPLAPLPVQRPQPAWLR